MSFFRWWIRQLASLASALLLPLYLKTGRAAILEIAGNSFALHVRRRGVVTPIAEGTLPQLKPALMAIKSLPPLGLLKAPSQQLLRKRVRLPLAARRNLGTVLAFEIDRETPFEAAEVHWGYSLVRATKDQLDVDLVVVPRHAANTLTQTARLHGFAPAALEVANDGLSPTLLWLETPDLFHYLRPPAAKRIPALAAAFAAAAILVLLPFAVQQLRLFFAEQTIAALESRARAASALNLAADRRAAGLAFMAQSQHGESALTILAAASRALPDDSFLNALTVHQGQVTMAGSSQAAAKLIAALAASAAFRDPVFDSAVLQNQGDDLEKFTISARLAGGS